jgi:hypothetical protein
VKELLCCKAEEPRVEEWRVENTCLIGKETVQDFQCVIDVFNVARGGSSSPEQTPVTSLERPRRGPKEKQVGLLL